MPMQIATHFTMEVQKPVTTDSFSSKTLERLSSGMKISSEDVNSKYTNQDTSLKSKFSSSINAETASAAIAAAAARSGKTTSDTTNTAASTSSASANSTADVDDTDKELAAMKEKMMAEASSHAKADMEADMKAEEASREADMEAAREAEREAARQAEIDASTAREQTMASSESIRNSMKPDMNAGLTLLLS